MCRIWACVLVILSKHFYGFTQSFQASPEWCIRFRPQPLCSISVLVLYSVIILSFDSIQLKLLTVSLNKPHKHRQGVNNKNNLVVIRPLIIFHCNDSCNIFNYYNNELLHSLKLHYSSAILTNNYFNMCYA